MALVVLRLGGAHGFTGMQQSLAQVVLDRGHREVTTASELGDPHETILTLDSTPVQYWSVRLSNELSRTGVLAFLPVVVFQGRRVRRRVERLPEATGISGQVGSGGDLLRVVVVGDSVAAGVGVREHRHSMAGRLADL